MPFQSIDDFVNTMRQSSSGGDAAFLWPSERMGIMRAIAVAIHHLPVGHMVSIKNAQKIPAKFYEKDGSLKWHVTDLYHGTSAFQVPNIMGKGFCPTLGAGCDALEAQFGVPVPGVYVAESWKVSTIVSWRAVTASGTEAQLSGGAPWRQRPQIRGRLGISGSLSLRSVRACAAAGWDANK